jgi:hypothetical protein
VDIVEKRLSLDGRIKFRMVTLKCSPVLLSNNVATTCSEGLVNKEAPFIKASFEPTNDSLSRVSHFKMNLLIDFITNIVEPVLNENNFVNVIQFREEKRCFVVVDWFQILKNFNHEFLVLEVSPGVVTVSIWVLIIWDAEVPSKLLKETFE